jgi:hypothetical protein
MNFATIEGLGRFVAFYVAVRRQVGRATAIGVAALGLAGCATGPVGGITGAASNDAKVALVTKRAQERWDALLNGNVKAAYAYLSPASRQVISLERYEQKTNPANFRSIKFRNVSCQEQTCQVDLWLTFDHRVMKGVQTPIGETWVFENGQAWYVYRE